MTSKTQKTQGTGLNERRLRGRDNSMQCTIFYWILEQRKQVLEDVIGTNGEMWTETIYYGIGSMLNFSSGIIISWWCKRKSLFLGNTSVRI